MKFKTLDDFLYAGHMVGSYIDFYGQGSTPPTPPTPAYEDWDDMATKTWSYFLDNNYTWDMLGQPA